MFFMAGCSGQMINLSEAEEKAAPFKLIVATDLHYLSPELIERGGLFEEMLRTGDGKQTDYIGQLTDAFLEEVIEEKPQGLILSGDLTFNGEKKSHEELAGKLKRVEEAGISAMRAV